MGKLRKMKSSIAADLQRCVEFRRLGVWNQTSTGYLNEHDQISSRNNSGLRLVTLSHFVNLHYGRFLEEGSFIFIKIDVQGADYAVVQGARALLASQAECAVIVETGDLYIRMVSTKSVWSGIWLHPGTKVSF